MMRTKLLLLMAIMTVNASLLAFVLFHLVISFSSSVFFSSLFFLQFLAFASYFFLSSASRFLSSASRSFFSFVFFLSSVFSFFSSEIITFELDDSFFQLIISCAIVTNPVSSGLIRILIAV
jgi:hypothetical protein